MHRKNILASPAAEANAKRIRIVTSELLCYTGEGFTVKRFELDVPVADCVQMLETPGRRGTLSALLPYAG